MLNAIATVNNAVEQSNGLVVGVMQVDFDDQRLLSHHLGGARSRDECTMKNLFEHNCRIAVSFF